MQIDTRSEPLFLTNPLANSTTAGTSIANPAPTATTPSGDGVIAMGHGGEMESNGLLLLPYGVGTATNTFLMSVFAWDRVLSQGVIGQTDLWVAWLLCSFTCALCTLAGVANTPVNASQLFCGTITLGVGNANVSNEIISPTGNVMASILLDAKGPRYIEVRFAMNASSTSANCLARKL